MKTLSPLPGRRPAGTKPSSLLDANGRPVSWFLYPSPRLNPRQYKPRQWLADSTKSNVSSYDRMELVNYSRQLRAQIDTLDAAIEAKNNWAFGDAWDAHYTGLNRKWGDAFEDFINNVWMPNCNVRGPLYGFKTTMMLSGQAWDVDGDDAMILTENANGFPQIAMYPATRIASGGANRYDKNVTGGPYDGATLCDGVIFDRNSRPIALRIVGEDGQHQDISSYNADLAYEPKWSDQGRGIPRIAVSLLKWMNLQDIDEFLQRGMKRAAAVGLLKKTAEGEALPNEVSEEEADEESPDGITRTVGYEEIEGGEMYYLSAPDGETIEGLDYKNPHPNVENYIHRVHRGALQSVGWFLELIDLTATGRAPTRVLCDLANQTIWSRQCTQYRRWKRAITFATFKAMKTGYLARNDDVVDALRFEPGLPKPMSVDAGNDASADREALKLGLTTRSIISQKWHGMHFRALDSQRELELRATIKTAEGLSKDHPQLSFDRALELLEQRSPNPIAQQRQPQSAEAKKNAQTTGNNAAETVNLNLKLHQEQKPTPRRRVEVQRDDEGAITGYQLIEVAD